MSNRARIPVPAERIAEFCRRWGVREFWLFGSVLSDEFSADSDVDVLLEFLPHSTASTWDWPRMTDELEAVFGRRVDLLSSGVLRNPFRRESILARRELVYAA